MTAFVSWSGGKDCSLALYSFLKNPDNRVSHLVHIANSPLNSTAQCLGTDLLFSQSEAMGIPLIRQEVALGNTYELHLKSIVSELKKQGVNAGVFGDIHLKEHRVWIERVCQEMGITPVFPLWERDTSGILHELVDSGFRTILIAVKNKLGLSDLIGRELDNDLIAELKQLPEIDVCGEHGEYHTFVFDSPLYSQPIAVSHQKQFVENDTTFLSLSPVPLTKKQ